ncbi:unnamed protein product, partial [Amoebophrya sp. A25]
LGGVASRDALSELTKKLQAWRDCSKAAEYVKHTVLDSSGSSRDMWPTRHRICSDVLKRGMGPQNAHKGDQLGPRGYKDPPT